MKLNIRIWCYMNYMSLFSFSVVWSFGYGPTFSAQSLNIIKMKRKWKLRSLLQPSTSANVGGILEFFVQIWKSSQRSNCEGRFPNPDEDGPEEEEEETQAEASFIKDLVKRRWAASAFPATVFWVFRVRRPGLWSPDLGPQNHSSSFVWDYAF